MMKKKTLFAVALSCVTMSLMAQDIKTKDVPAPAKSALAQKYPEATKVSWEKEKGNYEANWGGKSGEDNAATFTPAGAFVDFVKAIPVSQLPAAVVPYVKTNYKVIAKEAGKVTAADGKISYEVEVKEKDLVFDENGNFVKVD